MTSEELIKKIENILQGKSLEEYLRENIVTQEERDYIDKLIVDAIYKNLDINS
jgi:hypothetical protein